MHRRSCVVAAALLCVTCAWLTPAPAHAFVPPSWRLTSIHRGIVGKWHLVDVRSSTYSSGTPGDVGVEDVVLDISSTTIRVNENGKETKVVTYQADFDEDGMVAVKVLNDAGGTTFSADLLLETYEAMTMYLLQGEDDVGIAMHFERVY